MSATLPLASYKLLWIKNFFSIMAQVARIPPTLHHRKKNLLFKTAHANEKLGDVMSESSGLPPSPPLSENSSTYSAAMSEDSGLPHSPPLSENSSTYSAAMSEDISLSSTPNTLYNDSMSEDISVSSTPNTLYNDSMSEVSNLSTSTIVSEEIIPPTAHLSYKGRPADTDTDHFNVAVVPVLSSQSAAPWQKSLLQKESRINVDSIDVFSNLPVTRHSHKMTNTAAEITVQSEEDSVGRHEKTPLIKKSRQNKTYEPKETYPRNRVQRAVPTNGGNDTRDIFEDLHESCLRYDRGIDSRPRACPCCCCQLLNPCLHRGRERGWVMLKAVIFPLVQDVARAVWVILEFLTSLVGFGLSLASILKQDKIEIFNVVHLALVSLSILLATIDMSCSLRCISCNRCNPCSQTCGSVWVDIVRMLLAEALIYPLIICDILEVVSGKSYEGKSSTDHLSFSLFILSCFSFVLYVFIARIVILLGIIRKTHRARNRHTSALTHEKTYSRSALAYQMVFFFHLIFQMIAQVLVLVTIGMSLYYDNYGDDTIDEGNGYLDQGYTDEDFIVGPELWCMIVLAYSSPLLSFLSFFLVTYYWAQEFPIAFCLDLISLWKMKRGPEDFINIGDRILNPRDELMPVITDFYRKLKPDYEELHDRNWCSKFAYPFRNPLIAVLCVLYVLLQLAPLCFCAVFAAIFNSDLSVTILFFTYLLFALIVDAYAYSVFIFWMIIVPPLMGVCPPIVFFLLWFCHINIF